MDSKKLNVQLISNNKTLELTENSLYKVVSIEGLDSSEYEINTINNIQCDGVSVIDRKVKKRPIFIVADYVGSDVEAERKSLVSFFNPKEEGILIVNYLNRERTIKYYVEDFKCKIININEPISFKVDLICPNPFLNSIVLGEEISTLIGGFSFPFNFPVSFATKGDYNKNIINEGDVGTSLEVTFKGPAINPKITNLLTGEFIRVKRNLTSDDTLIINTEFGNKKVEILKSDGTKQNAFNWIDLNSTFFQLNPGDNVLQYSSDDELQPSSVSVKYTNRYLGI